MKIIFNKGTKINEKIETTISNDTSHIEYAIDQQYAINALRKIVFNKGIKNNEKIESTISNDTSNTEHAIDQ